MGTRKILVADDSSMEAELIRRWLEPLAASEVTVVEDGAAAVRAARKTRFDLVLVDYEMPTLNGLQVVRLLRGTWSRHELPILMLTVRDDVQTKVLSLRQGANDYVTKPVEPEELLARVQAHLDLRLAVDENIKARMKVLEGRKLETIGRLAAGLAHELNTPAQFTADNLSFLRRVFGCTVELLERTRTQVARLEPSEHAWANDFLEFWKKNRVSFLLDEAPKALDEASSGVMRMARIVRELKEFAGAADDWGASDLNRAIENTTYVSRQLWTSVAQVTFRFDEALPLIVCDATALKQAFFNILMALLASLERTSAVPQQLAQIEIETCRGGDGVEVRFHAQGRGLGSALQALREGLDGGGARGISADHELALAHAVVVRQHQGALVVAPPSERGVTFVVRLPERASSVAPLKPIEGFVNGPG